MGFDRIWAVEHHSLTQYAHMSASEVFLTWVAARTSRIRIGHGVVTMPFGYQHPVRVAERAAMLDVLSGGRVDIGAGRGATRQEMSMYGVRPEDTYPQMEEALRIFASAWKEERFEWHGSIDIGPGAILPRPVQDPHPPLFMACSKHDTLKLAAELGIGALVMGFAGADDVRTMRTVYDEAIAARSGEHLVSDHANDHLSALCPPLVLDDAERALRLGTRGQRFFAESIAHWYGGSPAPTRYAEEDSAEVHTAALAQHREELVARLHEAAIPARPVDTGPYKPLSTPLYMTGVVPVPPTSRVTSCCAPPPPGLADGADVAEPCDAAGFAASPSLPPHPVSSSSAAATAPRAGPGIVRRMVQVPRSSLAVPRRRGSTAAGHLIIFRTHGPSWRPSV